MKADRAVVKELFEERRGEYWRDQYNHARQERDGWRQRAEAAEPRVAELEEALSAVRAENDALQARVKYLEREVFGRKSEQTPTAAGEVGVAGGAERILERRGRGKQRGAKGYGRRRRLTLPTEEVRHELSEAACRCPRCGKPFVSFPGTEDSEEIHYEVRLVRRVHQRSRYRPTCTCGAVPGIVTAPLPAKVIPKGMFSTGFWVEVMLEKYLFQHPLYRMRQRLALYGLEISQGTLTGGLQRLLPLLEPLYAGILARVKEAGHWQMDETGWRVFEEIEGKTGHQWWLWVVVTRETCCYLLEPSRCSEVPRRVLGKEARGILNADRNAVYKSLGDGILVSWCWSHIRRDYRRVRDEHPPLQAWGQGWVDRIDELFRLNGERLSVWGKEAGVFAPRQEALEKAVKLLRQRLTGELKQASLTCAQSKALKSLERHWEGAILFVDHPTVPMDNNECERRLRNPVVGRKNYYGNGSKWSGRLSAVLFTLLQTLLKNDLDPRQFLLTYFQVCAENGGVAPENVEAFLPWNLTGEQRAAWRFPAVPRESSLPEERPP